MCLRILSGFPLNQCTPVDCNWLPGNSFPDGAAAAMFFISLRRPSKPQEQSVCEKGLRLGFNFNSPGGSLDAPPLPSAVQQDGWWNVDHERIKVGYGRKTYEATKELLSSWGQFQLPWAQVDPTTPIKAGTPVCVSANVIGLWTAVPLKIVYKQEGRWTRHHSSSSRQQQQEMQQPAAVRPRKKQYGQQISYAHACLKTHYLAGEERFRVEWDRSDDSVWYDIYTYSRPDHPLAYLGYPIVRLLQQQFRQQSMRAVARAAAAHTVDSSLDEKTRLKIERFEASFLRPEQLEVK